jgi:hypothetical protein
MITKASYAAPLPFTFERAPVPALVQALVPGGPLGFITDIVRGDNLWDLGFRGSRVDVYRGRSVVLQIEADAEGLIRLVIELPKYRKAGFDVSWNAPRDPAEFESAIPAIREYLRAVSLVVPATFSSGEAIYHGALTHHRLPSTPGVVVVDRQAVLGGAGKAVDRDPALQRPRQSYDRLAGESIGKEADALAVEADGSILYVVEVKSDAKSIDKAVAQVSWHAALFRWWVSLDQQLASQTIEALATARHALNLAPTIASPVNIERVVPVIALPRSAAAPSPSAMAEAVRRLTGALGHDGAVPVMWELDNRTVRA